MIEIIELTKIFSEKIIAVDNINLQIKEGKVVGFLGPNGAGKTTTINMIVGLCKPTAGKILIDGMDIREEPEKVKKIIGFVPDDPLLFEKITGISYLNFICDVFEVSIEERRKRGGWLLQAFKLLDAIKDPISTYSHGMRQKLALISALIHNPKILILDEPIVGLDPESASILKKIMKRHASKGNVVFFTTHIMEIAEKICDEIAIIDKGKIIFQGTINELRKIKGDKSLEQLFLEVTKSENEKMDFSFLD
ncbi:MAG TPA: ABC transporter ATP-binding protein [Defluviitoga sp.]|nr:ABC transporter ATP-binding protein [Defluviitoga sp.]HOP23776.1 ABC transporter ATP-binding protein [Defluviitoga sp.]HPZ28477.1 ABC transporter ATP-binding protein [Defluviitoga sp.]HQD62789.1 ABC transporter ATP-binding protein [Defluviitoga sp.]